MTMGLHIGPDRVVFSADGREVVVAGLGALTLGQEHFQRLPPGGVELEAAIDAIEEALAPAILALEPGDTLVTSDPETLALVEFAGFQAGEGARLDIADVERQFNRLVAVATGRPATVEGLPLRASFIANLVILREVMHHAGRRALVFAPPS